MRSTHVRFSFEDWLIGMTSRGAAAYYYLGQSSKARERALQRALHLINPWPRVHEVNQSSLLVLIDTGEAVLCELRDEGDLVAVSVCLVHPLQHDVLAAVEKHHASHGPERVRDLDLLRDTREGLDP